MEKILITHTLGIRCEVIDIWCEVVGRSGYFLDHYLFCNVRYVEHAKKV